MNTVVRENRDADRGQNEQFVAPSASVVEAGDGYTLEVEMPGINKEGLEISIENNELTVLGHRSRLALARRLLLFSSARSSITAAARPSTSAIGTSNPVSPLSMISLAPSVAVADTGLSAPARTRDVVRSPRS